MCVCWPILNATQAPVSAARPRAEEGRGQSARHIKTQAATLRGSLYAGSTAQSLDTRSAQRKHFVWKMLQETRPRVVLFDNLC